MSVVLACVIPCVLTRWGRMTCACAQHVDLRIEPLSSTGSLGVGRLQGLQGTASNWLPFCPSGFVDSASAAACAAVGYEGGGLVSDLCAIAVCKRAPSDGLTRTVRTLADRNDAACYNGDVAWQALHVRTVRWRAVHALGARRQRLRVGLRLGDNRMHRVWRGDGELPAHVRQHAEGRGGRRSDGL